LDQITVVHQFADRPGAKPDLSRTGRCNSWSSVRIRTNRYYLPYYLRTELAGLTHQTGNYQLLYISIVNRVPWCARRRRRARSDTAARGWSVAACALIGSAAERL